MDAVSYCRKRGAILVHGQGTRWRWSIDTALITGGTVPLRLEGTCSTRRQAWADAQQALAFCQRQTGRVRHDTGTPWLSH